MVTVEEAVECFRRCLEEYPDPEKTLEDYVEKLGYNLCYGKMCNILILRHLVEEKTEGSNP